MIVSGKVSQARPISAAKARSLPKIGVLGRCSTQVDSGLTRKCWIRLESFVSYKRSRLFGLVVSDEEKGFVTEITKVAKASKKSVC